MWFRLAMWDMAVACKYKTHQSLRRFQNKIHVFIVCFENWVTKEMITHNITMRNLYKKCLTYEFCVWRSLDFAFFGWFLHTRRGVNHLRYKLHVSKLFAICRTFEQRWFQKVPIKCLSEFIFGQFSVIRWGKWTWITTTRSKNWMGVNYFDAFFIDHQNFI